MSAPVPSPRLSPMAGLVNACRRLYIKRALPLIAAQQQAVDEARNLNHRLRDARNFADSDDSGYVDRSPLER
ncbi:hypothetical protein AB0N99_30475 [Streptomyces sp. NPDC093272]|uniref:hypothetical protein n=1 Tax=Streptomyces sp. NPDC093272 TaxID=3154981 RepID=UPI00341F4F98